jgi:2-dehydro-3-deoxygluconokinase
MTKVVCIGECMVELSPRQGSGYELGFAGDAFNTAVYLKRSAPQFTVHFLTVTGVDRFSQAMRAAWRAEGIAEDLAFTVSDAIPGLYVVSVDQSGERSFTYWRSTSAARRWFESLGREGGVECLVDADLIYFSGISLAILPDEQRSTALELLATLGRRSGCKIAFDPNYRPALWPSKETAQKILAAAMELADIVLPSQEDLAAADLKVPSARECITTCGAKGCRVATPTSETFLEAPRVPGTEIRDTSGAGDAFNGAYLAERLAGSEPVSAATAALAVAARVVTASGALVRRGVSHPVI